MSPAPPLLVSDGWDSSVVMEKIYWGRQIGPGREPSLRSWQNLVLILNGGYSNQVYIGINWRIVRNYRFLDSWFLNSYQVSNSRYRPLVGFAIVLLSSIASIHNLGLWRQIWVSSEIVFSRGTCEEMYFFSWITTLSILGVLSTEVVSQRQRRYWENS